MSETGDRQEKEPRAAKDGECPFCASRGILCVTDCYDTGGKRKICELWFCNDCSGFFPRMISIERPGPGAASVTEKRRTPRFPVQFVVQVDFAPAAGEKRSIFRRERDQLSEPLVAMVMDAGLGGLCFRYPHSVEEGREGKMLISLPSVERSFTARARVVRSTKLPDGSFGLGVQFIDVEPDYREALNRYLNLK